MFKMASWRTSYHCDLCSTTYDHLGILLAFQPSFQFHVRSSAQCPPASSLTRSSSSPPFQSASGVARLSGCCDSTRLLIIRPPTPLHHPSSHTVASLVLPYSCIIRPPTPLHHLHHLHHLASVGNPWHSASSSHRPWLTPSCRQAVAKLPPRASELSP